tara:strand:+ start:1138 stop:1455 length:318 start_codon:yes stop_codon:yes gene_type:complete
MNMARITKFNKWWKKNHHHVNSHMWLMKNLNRIIHNYNNPPESYAHAKTILKRYNLSKYKRLTKEDALFAWRMLHPSANDRNLRLLATAAFLQTKADDAGRKFSK